MKRIFVSIMILIAFISCGIRSSQRKNVNITIDEMAAYSIEVIEDSTSSWSQIRKTVNLLSESLFALINYVEENAELYHDKG